MSLLEYIKYFVITIGTTIIVTPILTILISYIINGIAELIDYIDYHGIQVPIISKKKRILLNKINKHNEIINYMQDGLKEGTNLFMLNHIANRQRYNQIGEWAKLEISIKTFQNDVCEVDINTIKKLKDLLVKLEIPENIFYSKKRMLKKIEDSNNIFKEENALRDKIKLLCITSPNKLDFLKYYDQLYMEV